MVTTPESDSATPERVEPDARRQLWVLLLATLGSALSIRAVYEISETLRAARLIVPHDPAAAGAVILQLVDRFLYGTAAVLALFALYLVIQGARIRRAGRYPPPGAKVVVATKVVTGRAAASRALVGWILAALLAATAALLPTWGRGYVHRTLPLPDPSEALPPEVFDPDQFPAAVPGPALTDPTDPRHPANREREKE